MNTSHPLRAVAAVVLSLLIVVCGLLWWRSTHKSGMHAISTGRTAGTIRLQPKKADSLISATLAYNKGNYKAAEAEALLAIESSVKSSDPKAKKDAVEARYILAFSAARRKDMKLARDRFENLRKEAAKLPDKGKQDAKPGMMTPTLEEEGAYQHAVCTAALGDKKGAQVEYLKFIRSYPEGIRGRSPFLTSNHEGLCSGQAGSSSMQMERAVTGL